MTERAKIGHLRACCEALEGGAELTGGAPFAAACNLMNAALGRRLTDDAVRGYGDTAGRRRVIASLAAFDDAELPAPVALAVVAGFGALVYDFWGGPLLAWLAPFALACAAVADVVADPEELFDVVGMGIDALDDRGLRDNLRAALARAGSPAERLRAFSQFAAEAQATR